MDFVITFFFISLACSLQCCETLSSQLPVPVGYEAIFKPEWSIFNFSGVETGKWSIKNTAAIVPRLNNTPGYAIKLKQATGWKQGSVWLTQPLWKNVTNFRVEVRLQITKNNLPNDQGHFTAMIQLLDNTLDDCKKVHGFGIWTFGKQLWSEFIHPMDQLVCDNPANSPTMKTYRVSNCSVGNASLDLADFRVAFQYFETQVTIHFESISAQYSMICGNYTLPKLGELLASQSYNFFLGSFAGNANPFNEPHLWELLYYQIVPEPPPEPPQYLPLPDGTITIKMPEYSIDFNDTSSLTANWTLRRVASVVTSPRGYQAIKLKEAVGWNSGSIWSKIPLTSSIDNWRVEVAFNAFNNPSFPDWGSFFAFQILEKTNDNCSDVRGVGVWLFGGEIWLEFIDSADRLVCDNPGNSPTMGKYRIGNCSNFDQSDFDDIALTIQYYDEQLEVFVRPSANPSKARLCANVTLPSLRNLITFSGGYHIGAYAGNANPAEEVHVHKFDFFEIAQNKTTTTTSTTTTTTTTSPASTTSLPQFHYNVWVYMKVDSGYIYLNSTNVSATDWQDDYGIAGTAVNHELVEFFEQILLEIFSEAFGAENVTHLNVTSVRRGSIIADYIVALRSLTQMNEEQIRAAVQKAMASVIAKNGAKMTAAASAVSVNIVNTDAEKLKQQQLAGNNGSPVANSTAVKHNKQSSSGQSVKSIAAALMMQNYVMSALIGFLLSANLNL